MNNRLSILGIAVLLICVGLSGCNEKQKEGENEPTNSEETQQQNWNWKKSTTPDDVIDFLNGQGAYNQPIEVVKISAIWNGDYNEFFIFYKSGTEGQSSGNWSWKLSTDSDDVIDFLNGQGTYEQPVKDSVICSILKDTYTEYYVFYK